MHRKLLTLTKDALRPICAILFVLAGIAHFKAPHFFEAIIPESFPFPLALVYISGFFEILGGLGLLVPRLRKYAGWGLMALLVAVFPANVNMAVNCIDFGLPHDLLWWRLPFQVVLIAFVWCLTHEKN